MVVASSPPIQSTFVLGSTSEVAKAICRELARRGCPRFHLVARNAEANAQLANELQQRYGAAVSTETTDLLADAALNPARRPDVGEYDLYMIAAGSLGDAALARNDASEALRILAANVSGLIPWITAIATPERLS
ncbi:MAG: KR domain-containing protein, partial [Cyanobium sp.]